MGNTDSKITNDIPSETYPSVEPCTKSEMQNNQDAGQHAGYYQETSDSLRQRNVSPGSSEIAGYTSQFGNLTC